MINWRKSSHTGGGNDEACVEIAGRPHKVWVRDSKNPEAGRLELSRKHFANLLTHVKRNALSL
ncbi:hypothetical protein GCM10027589_31800 [Actinocorallia lasiicapitis]